MGKEGGVGRLVVVLGGGGGGGGQWGWGEVDEGAHGMKRILNIFCSLYFNTEG